MLFIPAMFLAIQFLAALLVWGFCATALGGLPVQASWLLPALAIGVAAALLAMALRRPWWQWPMHLAFAPLLVFMHGAHWPPWVFLLLFVLCWLCFRGAAKNRVPLFFSSRKAAEALAGRLPQGARLVDLGAGIGSLLVPLSRLRPDLRLAGVENAPLVWLWGRIRTAGRSIDWLYGDFFNVDLGSVDAAYAFLSPAPMEALWEKAVKEMPPGALFISKAFAVPQAEPCETVDAGGGKPRDCLLIYKIPG